MHCPNDNAVLQMTVREGIEIDYCPTCRGVWLDRGELDKLIERGNSFVQSSHQQQQQQPNEGYRHEPNRRYDDDDDDDRHHSYPQQHGGHYDSHNPHHKKKEGFFGEIFDF